MYEKGVNPHDPGKRKLHGEIHYGMRIKGGDSTNVLHPKYNKRKKEIGSHVG